tara:strand:+ start:406 stop:687 length:282 start_codon:yes stop_codon:yes gene_type:complete
MSLKEQIEHKGMEWVDRMPWMLANEPLANMSYKAGATAAIKLIVDEMEAYNKLKYETCDYSLIIRGGEELEDHIKQFTSSVVSDNTEVKNGMD